PRPAVRSLPGPAPSGNMSPVRRSLSPRGQPTASATSRRGGRARFGAERDGIEAAAQRAPESGLEDGGRRSPAFPPIQRPRLIDDRLHDGVLEVAPKRSGGR